MTIRMVVLWLLGYVLASSVCCDDGPTRPRGEAGWRLLGLEDMTVRSLELDYPYLYACAGGKGLYRLKVTSENPEWDYLGLASSAFPNAFTGGLSDALVLDGGPILAAACYWARDGTNYPGLYLSEDGGLTWVSSDSGITLDRGDFCCPASLSGCDHYSFVGTVGCGTYRSGDNGVHWDMSGAYLGWWYVPSWIEQSPADCSVIWQAGDDARESYLIAVSNDHGATWNWVHPSRGFGDTYVIALDPVDANTAYVGMRDSVVKTVDLGASFETALELPEGAWVMALAHGQFSGHMFIAVAVYHGHTGTVEPFLYETRDACASVDTLTIPMRNVVWDMLYDNQRKALYVAAKGGVYEYIHQTPHYGMLD